MAHYASDSELYSDLGECLREVLCDPANADKARGVGSVIRIETVRPQARITLNLAADGDPEVVLGDCDLRPAAVITMEADAARGFFLGEVSLIGALSAGRMTAQGPVAPILRVVPLANLVAPRFQEFDGSGASRSAGAEEPPVEEEETAGEGAPETEEPPVGEEGAADDDEASEQEPDEEVAGQAPAADEDSGEPAEPVSGEDQS